MIHMKVFYYEYERYVVYDDDERHHAFRFVRDAWWKNMIPILIVWQRVKEQIKFKNVDGLWRKSMKGTKG
jgi:hypothetical protein